MTTSVNASREQTTACQEATEANSENLEANAEEMKTVAELEKVPKEDVSVEIGRAPKKRRRGRNLEAERRQKRKERTRENCGSWNKLAPTEGWPALQEWHGTRNTVVRNNDKKMLQEEPLKDGSSGEDVGWIRKQLAHHLLEHYSTDEPSVKKIVDGFFKSHETVSTESDVCITSRKWSCNLAGLVLLYSWKFKGLNWFGTERESWLNNFSVLSYIKKV
jgi:hypothetical protein